MKASTKPRFEYLASYGQTPLDTPDFTGPVPDSFTFNSPIGLCMDHRQQVWVCDTGNNRIVILDKDLTRILRILHCPDPGSSGPGAIDFRMPFHVCCHPDRERIYITDMGNSRVVVMDYAADRFTFAGAFGNESSARFDGLQDPNGVTVVRHKKGVHIHVNDEFYHTATEPKRNRCVRFDEDGSYIDEFRTVIDPDGNHHDLYWPQGLSSDAAGNLYIANTGAYEILKCSSTARIDKNYCINASQPVVSHKYKPPKGIGMLGIMRGVNVIGERVFVPDHIVNTISVFDLHSHPLTTIKGVRPSWRHDHEQVDSITDPAYYALENASLLNPYAIVQGEAPDIFFVSEPLCSRIIKLQIKNFSHTETPVTFLTGLGARRDEPGKDRRDPQFNFVTSVVNLTRSTPTRRASDFDPTAELPAYLKYNPLQRGYMQFGETVARQYRLWYGDWSRHLRAATEAAKDNDAIRLNLDAGNWEFKSYAENGRDFSIAPRPLTGYFLPGNLAMAVYHPRTPLLGQICPDTPIVFVSNFNMGTVSLYQTGPLGNLINYGLPFGILGDSDGCLNGPQGMAISDDGEIFVVDSHNNRIAKWQILQTGQIIFIKNFKWQGRDSHITAFTPTDVAIAADKRLFVTDQFNNRICVFDHHGNSLWCQGQEGYWAEDQADGDGNNFMLPTSVAIDGDHLIINDLVNRALKIFRIGQNSLDFEGGISLFKLTVDQGGVWMPFFMHAQDRQVSVADSTYNVVQVYRY